MRWVSSWSPPQPSACDRRMSESVWSYPRPPRVEPLGRRALVEFDGVVIADSRRALRVLETSHPPAIYFPPDDVRRDSARERGQYLRVEGPGLVLGRRRPAAPVPRGRLVVCRPFAGLPIAPELLRLLSRARRCLLPRRRAGGGPGGRLLWGLDYCRHRRAVQRRRRHGRLVRRQRETSLELATSTLATLRSTN